MADVSSYGHSTFFVVQMKGRSACAYIRVEAKSSLSAGDQVLRYQPRYSLQATYCHQAK